MGIRNGRLPPLRYRSVADPPQFAVIVPICLIPVIGSLMWAQNKAKKQLKAARGGHHISTKTRLQNAWKSFQELDIIGLVLVATSLALILLPLTLAANVPGGWRNNTMRGMLVGGLLLFPVFCWYETKIPRLPLVPYRFLRNRTILGACLIGEYRSMCSGCLI
jgi:MFS family permease